MVLVERSSYPVVCSIPLSSTNAILLLKYHIIIHVSIQTDVSNSCFYNAGPFTLCRVQGVHAPPHVSSWKLLNKFRWHLVLRNVIFRITEFMCFVHHLLVPPNRPNSVDDSLPFHLGMKTDLVSKILQDLTWDQTQSSAVGSRRLYAWATAWLLIPSVMHDQQNNLDRN